MDLIQIFTFRTEAKLANYAAQYQQFTGMYVKSCVSTVPVTLECIEYSKDTAPQSVTWHTLQGSWNPHQMSALSAADLAHLFNHLS